jgi:glucosyl-3-phosphoglycerate synthase
VSTRAVDWFARATTAAPDWDADALVAAKAGRRISVVLPARNEAATIGPIVAGIRSELIRAVPLVDEIVVIDSDSTDETGAVARSHGAEVYEAAAIRPELDRYPGKGEALWKSQFVTSGDVLVFIDADLTGWGTHFVTGLLGPLLTNPGVTLVKGFYDRLLDDGSNEHSPQGGRVTELVARPLLNLYWPDLTHVVQPLAGEWAIRRDTFAASAVPVGYGVEIATLIDVYLRDGLDAIAQVDLGARAHAHQSVHDLGVMAAELLLVAARRLRPEPESVDPHLWQFTRPEWRQRSVPTVERPPFDRSRSSRAEAR